MVYRKGLVSIITKGGVMSVAAGSPEGRRMGWKGKKGGERKYGDSVKMTITHQV